uniref:SFRICE_033437 n=1 Tax=Spodoptera frugiperda TaxID=7108 RepID=A0A2H1WQW4_SPOFR
MSISIKYLIIKKTIITLFISEVVCRGAHYGALCRYTMYTHFSPFVLLVPCNRGVLLASARDFVRGKFKN